MTDDLLWKIVESLPVGYAYHRVLFGSDGKAEDYVFLEVNPAFEEMTGLKREDVIGKRATEVLPGIESEKFDWIGFYGSIARGGEKREFVQYSEALRRWYKVTAFSPERNYFVTFFQEISEDIYKAECVKAIGRISRLALQERSPEVFLGESLRLLGETTGVSRVYIFERDPQKETMSNTYEWTAPGVEPQKDFLQNLPEKSFRWWVEKLKIFPINVEGEYWGFIGFDDCVNNRNWADSEKTLLEIAAEVISQYLLRKKQEDRIWQENQRFSALVSSAEDLIFELDASLRTRALYGRAIEKLGLNRELSLGKRLQELFGQDKANVHEEAGKRALSGEAVVYEWKHGEGKSAACYQTSLSPLRDRARKITGVVGIARDITEIIRLQETLRMEKELLRTTLLSIGECVVTTDMSGKLTGMNRAAEKISGWKEQEVLGRAFEDVFRLIDGKTKKLATSPIAKVLRTGKLTRLADHTLLVTRDGREISVAGSAAPITGEDGRISGVVAAIRDITEEKKKQEEILYLSYHDQLTGLYNRRFVEEEMKRIDAPQNLPLAVIMGDLNGLKLVNDIFGHAFGDVLLHNHIDPWKPAD
ncbi:MAG: PAS domain S-box protein, partial [Thermacetogeniaceae bacterium]